LLGNLSLSYLLAGRIEHARRAIDAAIRIAPDDSINQTISRILSEITEGLASSGSDCDEDRESKPKEKDKS
jgi:hypothetical protein